MKACVQPIILACAAAYIFTPFAVADNIVASAPSTGGATIIYRQVLPNGRIMYSDKPIKGATVDHMLKVEPPIKGNLWTTDAGARPDIPPQAKSTAIIRKGNAVPAPGQKKTVADADSEVIRAEMLLEDAKKRQQAGVEPLPGERTGTAAGTSRLNDAYFARQKTLAQDVEQAEAAVRQAIAERDAMQPVR